MTDIAIRVQNLSKCYHIYDAPRDRLKQFVVPKLCRAFPPLRNIFSAHHSPFTTDQGVPTPHSSLPTYYREFWALKDISFEIKKGDTIGIIGRNGSGKSTLLQLICGTLSPTGGNVETNGRIAALLELGSGFNPEFTGRENVYMNAAVLGLNKDEVDERFDDIAAFADIGQFIDQPTKTYSSGMMVRLAFAVSVCVEPDVLIVDEALAVGDAAFQFKCIERLESLTRSGTTLLFVSHNLNQLKMFCNRALYLRNGCTRVSGLAEDVTNIYLMDLRDDQSSTNKFGERIEQKPALAASPNGFAYGTSLGKVVSAEFGTGERFCHLVRGQALSFWMQVEFDGSVRYPSVSVLVQSAAGIAIGGKYLRVETVVKCGGVNRVRLYCTFPANFTAGRHFISIRLEDRLTDQNFLVLEKQSAALSFEVGDSPGSDVTGIVDLGIKLTQCETL